MLSTAEAGASTSCVVENAATGAAVTVPTAQVVGVECDGPGVVTWVLSVPPEALAGLGGFSFEPWDRQGAPLLDVFSLPGGPTASGAWWTAASSSPDCDVNTEQGNAFSVLCDGEPEDGANIVMQLHHDGPVGAFIGHPEGKVFSVTDLVFGSYQAPPTTTTTTSSTTTTTTEPPPSSTTTTEATTTTTTTVAPPSTVPDEPEPPVDPMDQPMTGFESVVVTALLSIVVGVWAMVGRMRTSRRW